MRQGAPCCCLQATDWRVRPCVERAGSPTAGGCCAGRAFCMHEEGTARVVRVALGKDSYDIVIGRGLSRIAHQRGIPVIATTHVMAENILDHNLHISH